MENCKIEFNSSHIGKVQRVYTMSTMLNNPQFFIDSLAEDYDLDTVTQLLDVLVSNGGVIPKDFSISRKQDTDSMKVELEPATPNTSSNPTLYGTRYFHSFFQGGVESSPYKKAYNSFLRSIVSKLIYDVRTGKGIANPNALDSVTGLPIVNAQILNYVDELIGTINKLLGIKLEEVYPKNNGGYISKRIAYILDAFNDKLVKDKIFSEADIKSDPGYEEAYTAYAILSCLDELLEKSKLVSVSSEYKGKNFFAHDKYTYVGIQASYIEKYNEEDADISAYTSPIVKAILDVIYLDEDNLRGSIGLPCFTVTVGAMMDWAKSQRSERIRNELRKGVDANFGALIQAYLNSNERISSFTETVLNVIKDKIFDGPMGPELKTLFAVQALNTHHSAYVELVQENGKWTEKSAISRIYDKTKYILSEKLGNQVKYHFDNKELFEKRKRLKHITCSKTDNIANKYSIKFYDEVDKNVLLQVDVDLDIIRSSAANTNAFAFDTDFLDSSSGWNLIKEYFPVFTGIYIPESIKIETNGASLIRSLSLAIVLSSLKEARDLDGYIEEDSVSGNYYLSDKINKSVIASDISTISQIFGTSIVRNIKDLNGNILPSGELNCWFTNVNQIIDQALQNPDHVLSGNLFVSGANGNELIKSEEGAYLGCAIRKDMKRGDKRKDTKTMLPVETMTWSIFYDFLMPLSNPSNNDVWIQGMTFADKTRQFLDHVDLEKIKLAHGIPLASAIRAIREEKTIQQGGKSLNPKELIKRGIIEQRKESILRSAAYLIHNAIKTYGIQALGIENPGLAEGIHGIISYLTYNPKQVFVLQNKINKFLEGKSREQIVEDYKKAKADLYGSADEQTDIVETTSGNYILNPLLFHFADIFINGKSEEYFTKLEHKFAEDLKNMGFTISRNLIQAVMPEGIGDSISESIISSKRELNPLLEAYLYTHLLVGEQLQELHQGVSWAYRTKEVFDPENPNYDVDISGRFIDETKRAMGDGATIKMIPPRKFGVSRKINIVAVEDLVAPVNGLMGELGPGKDGEDLVADGCVYAAPEQALLENWSMPDGKVGKAFKKLIFNQIDSSGRLNQIKTAAFTLSNTLRRWNPHSEDFNMETAYRKTHSAAITIDRKDLFNLYYTPENTFSAKYGEHPISCNKYLFFFDPETGDYYKIKEIKYNSPNSATRILQKVDEYGNLVNGDLIPESKPINTVYDLDQLYGGAWCMELDTTSGKLKGSDANNEIVSTFLCVEDKKDAIVHYIVPISSFKVGMHNINSSDIFKLNASDEDLWTSEFDMGSVGVQLNAGHYVQGGYVAEPTQLVQAIGQTGVLTEIVDKLHKELAELTVNIKDKFADDNLDLAIAEELLHSIQNSGNNKSITDVFLLRMQNRLESMVDIKMPLSSPEINQKFESVIMTALNKAIKHRFSGLGAVQAPSWGFMQHFGNGLTYTELLKRLPSLNGRLTIKQVMEGVWDSNGYLDNNFIETCLELSKNHPAPIMENISAEEINFEDTILVKETSGYKAVKINGIKLYDKYRNLAPTGTRYIRWNTRGRDLLQQLVYFKTAHAENSKAFYTLFDFNTNRACFYLAELERAKKEDIIENFAEKKALILKVLPGYKEIIDGYLDKENKKQLKVMLQIAKDKFNETCKEYSEANKAGVDFTTKDLSVVGEEVTLLKPEIKHAQVMLGRLYAKKLGLDYGDNVREILDYSKYHPGEPEYGFFKKRLQGKYGNLNKLNGMVDAVLHSEQGNIYVMFDGNPAWNDLSIKSNFTFKNIDGSIFYNGNRIVGAEGIEEKLFTDDEGQAYNFIRITSKKQLQALESSGEFDLLEYNVRGKNLKYSRKFFSNFLNKKISDLEAEGQSDEKAIVDYLRAAEKNKRERFIDNLAKRRFEAFKTSLTLIGVRIPTQALQSVSAVDVISFTDSDENEVYLPRTLTWIAGSDYDIDKFYLSGWSILENGILPRKGNLYSLSAELVDSLPDPDGREFDWVEIPNESTIQISIPELIAAHADPIKWADLLRTILSNKNITSVYFVGSLETESDVNIFDLAAESLISDLNRYNNETNAKRVSRISAEIKMNNVVRSMIQGFNDVAVQSALLTPLNDVQVKSASNKNADARADKNSMNPDLPTSIHKQQRNNMVAKSSVGIVANATKAFKVLCDDINKQLETWAVNIEKAVANHTYINTQDLKNYIKSILFRKKLVKDGETPYWTTFAGLNFRHLIKALERAFPSDENDSGLGFLEEGSITNLIDDLRELQKRSNKNDPDDALSNLMTAATDNAKVLYLNPLNATGPLLTLYCYLVCTGESLDDISDILTNPIFNIVRKYSEYSLFDSKTSEYNALKDAISFIKNEGDLGIVNKKALKEIYLKRINTLINTSGSSFKETLKNYGISSYRRSSSGTDAIKNEDEAVAIKAYKDFLETAEEQEWQALIREANNYPATKDKLSPASYIANYLRRRARDLKALNDKEPGFKEKALKNLNLIEGLLPAAEEFNKLSTRLSINQGQKGTSYEQYKFISDFERDINNAYKGHSTEPFTVENFFNPDNAGYTEAQIAAYEAVKVDINILKYLNESPHFKEMYRTLVKTEQITKSKAMMSALTRKLCDEYMVSSQRPISKVEYGVISKYAADLLVYQFLTNLPSEFAWQYAPASNAEKVEVHSLNEASRNGKVEGRGLVEFKKFMDTVLIPSLMDGSIDSELAKNKFTQALSWHRGKYNGFIESNYVIDLDRGVLDSTSEDFERVKADFLKIARVPLDERFIPKNIASGKPYKWTYGDLFYLYHLMISGGRYNSAGLGMIFSELAVNESYTNPLALRFQKTIAELDDTWRKVGSDKALLKSILNYDISDVRALVDRAIDNSLGTNLPNSTYDVFKFVHKESPSEEFKKPYTVEDNSFEQFQDRELPTELLKIFEDLFGQKRIQTVSNDWIIKNRKTLFNAMSSTEFNSLLENGTKGFVHNGVIYLKEDSWNGTTLFHEIAHVVAAHIKFSNNPWYYQAVDILWYSTDAFVSNIREGLQENYPNRSVSDLKEELFAEYIGQKIQKLLPTDTIENIEEKVQEAIREIFRIDPTNIDLGRLSISKIDDILKYFKSGLYSYSGMSFDSTKVVLNQKLMSIKHTLMNKSFKDDNSGDEVKLLEEKC